MNHPRVGNSGHIAMATVVDSFSGFQYAILPISLLGLLLILIDLLHVLALFIIS